MTPINTPTLIKQLQTIANFAAWPVAIGVIIALLALLLCPTLRTQQSLAPNSSATIVTSYANAVERAAPAVVNIYTEKTVNKLTPNYNNPNLQQYYSRPVTQQTLGSGVIVDKTGYILTNNHVINGADIIKILLVDGRQADASIVGIDKLNDLAVLRIQLDNLVAITAGRSNQIKVGDVVLAIGNPLGVGQSVTQGIVSATNRWNLGINRYENFIQTDAAINPGNSGGALINAQGELVGINTAILDENGANSVGISFAVPAETALNSLNQIIKYGEVRPIWLGISAKPLGEEGLDYFKPKGLIITDLEPNAPAIAAGLRVGDLIIKMNNLSFTDLRTFSSDHPFVKLIQDIKPDDIVKVFILRDGKELELKIKAELRPTKQTST